MSLDPRELSDFLENKYHQYNDPSFIESDPISIPHQFRQKEDIEISGFLTAIISWGMRKNIIRNAEKLMSLMDFAPYDFVMNFTEKDLQIFQNFIHRTFNSIDCAYFIRSLNNIYISHGGLEKIFNTQLYEKNLSMKEAIVEFRNVFFELPCAERTFKHISNPSKNASAKRINMFLRWMVRKDNCGVDFGIWKQIKNKQLICPLDIHTGNVARKLGLLKRKSNDWKAASQLTDMLMIYDPDDPVKYDFALFGLGIFEKF